MRSRSRFCIGGIRESLHQDEVFETQKGDGSPDVILDTIISMILGRVPCCAKHSSHNSCANFRKIPSEYEVEECLVAAPVVEWKQFPLADDADV